MSDRTVTSREQWPPSASAADRRRPHAFQAPFSGKMLIFYPRHPSNSHDVQRSPSWSTPKAMDNNLHPKPRQHRKSVRAEDLWD